MNAGNDVNAAGDVTTTNLYAADSVNAINSINAQQVNSTVSVNTPALNIQGGSLAIGMANDSVTGGTTTFGTATPAQGSISFGAFFDRSTGSSSSDPKIPLVDEGTTCNPDSTTPVISRSVGINSNGDILTCQAGLWTKTKAAQIVSSENSSCNINGINYQTAIDVVTGSLLTCDSLSNQFKYQRLQLKVRYEMCRAGEIAIDSEGNLLSCKPDMRFDRAEPEIPDGTMCGMRVTGDGRGPALRPCMGLDPTVACPPGYTLHSFPGFDFVYHHSCMKGQPPSATPPQNACPPNEFMLNGSCQPTIDGVCGSANGGSFGDRPSQESLCQDNTSFSNTAVQVDGNRFLWSCGSNNGRGTIASCQATKLPPTCGPAHGTSTPTPPQQQDLCQVGVASQNSPGTSMRNGTSFIYTWSCTTFPNGPQNPETAFCSAIDSSR